MDFKELSEKAQNQRLSFDNTFTNEDEIRYPTEDDLVDIKVLNNNIRLLDEQKAGGADLQNVAKETTPKNIENIVKNIQSTTNAINSNVTNIKNTVNTINSNVNNINSNVGSNLQQVAKERSQYSIEDKADEILSKSEDIILETTPKNLENIVQQISTNVQTLVNAKGIIKSIQRIRGALYVSNQKEKTISITPVDISKTIVITQGGKTFNTIPPAPFPIIAYLKSTSQLFLKHLYYEDFGFDYSVPYFIQIVEFY